MAVYTPDQLKWFRSQYKPSTPTKPRPARSLPPLQEAQYQQGISNANLGYGQGIAQNEYNRGQAGQQFTDQRQALVEQFRQMRNQMPYGANARGLLGSGIWKQGVMDANKLQAMKLASLGRARAGSLGQFDLLRQQLEQRRDDQLGGLRTARAAALQQLLLGLDGYGG